VADTRVVELVLVTPTGDVLGSLPTIPVATPWWPETGPIVEGARERHGIDVVVLRLLRADRDAPPGGKVTYLAEIAAQAKDGIARIRPWLDPLDDHPLRMPWARPGGPAADLAWADGLLAAHGIARTAPAEQIRTWNLSSLWRLPVQDGAVWLKHVPPFFGHEATIIDRLAGLSVPVLIGSDGPRMLMHEIPGEDMYDAGQPILARGLSLLVGIQRDWISRVDELLAMGLPDWRPAELMTLIEDVVGRTSSELSAEDRPTLGGFVSGLPGRFGRLAECGIPHSLVHGDFGPGNLRGDDLSLTLLDWGDCGVGHPLLDQPAMFDRAPQDAVGPLRDQWAAEWEAVVPGSDPRRAARLLAPVAAARQAVIYRKFLDNIEPSEHPYHNADPANWLARAAELVRAEANAA
jgi:Phosphotransferase enzyme family